MKFLILHSYSLIIMGAVASIMIHDHHSFKYGWSPFLVIEEQPPDGPAHYSQWHFCSITTKTVVFLSPEQTIVLIIIVLTGATSPSSSSSFFFPLNRRRKRLQISLYNFSVGLLNSCSEFRSLRCSAARVNYPEHRVPRVC